MALKVITTAAVALAALVLNCYLNAGSVKSQDCIEAAADALSAKRLDAGLQIVPVLHLAAIDGFADKLSRCRTPYVVLGSVVKDWQALAAWQPAYLIERLPQLLDGAYISRSDATLVLDAALLAGDRVMNITSSAIAASDMSNAATSEDYAISDSLPPIEGDPSGDMEDLPTTEFFRNENIFYYARWMGFNELAPLRADVNPTSSLYVDDHIEKAGETFMSELSPVERRYFRLANAGCVSALHFDEYHNHLAQVVGIKQVWLLPPSGWKATLAFPKGHARYRQSPRQPVFRWESSEFFRLGGKVLTLKPAEVLHIPPYWWHQTVTLERSVAVNVWSPSAEAMGAARAQTLVSPTDALGLQHAYDGADHGAAEHRGKPQQVHALTLFAQLVASTLSGSDDGGKRLLISIHRAQYAHLRDRAARRVRSEAEGQCNARDAFAALSLSPTAKAAAQRVANALGSLPDGTRQLAFSDYVSDLADYVASSLLPVWPGDRGRMMVLYCVFNFMN
mmetsp:Transcript_46815/g.77509  ORF Transcript_46815/g.77509 Transcript_46815/m.77509 type:complete len:507 (-) Transcript_46815:9-1529(-)|eukprot:CAMPEP_0119311538 /NCGR_PEP_ID=MMETSP1333-20130426/22800_1 /TAXON_ID=418940 /ORGANISM="Scyphosphaera apsteinii, Strain RCC1455" /LENGTH=506 /DNA_ID=CAMNT_0007315939 /DNA_START=100 /DNA_END=1620 /DNA_ORIENTATION=-